MEFAFPADVKRDFLLNGASLGAVYALAAQIGDFYRNLPKKEGPLCLYSSSRAIVAASCIASMTREMNILLPYALNDRVLSEIDSMIPLSGIITDNLSRAQSNLPSFAADVGKTSAGAPAEPTDFDRDFLFLFTGGSTGNPVLWSKTLMNIISEVLLLTQMFDLSSRDIILSTVPPLHIYGLLFTIFLPLITGARVVNEASYYPQEVFSALEKTGATVLVSTPAHYRVLRTDNFPNHSLRLAFSSAGALDTEDAERFYKMSGIGISEVFGSTETGGIATRCLAAGESCWRPFSGIKLKEVGERLYVRSPFASKEMHRDEQGYCRTGDRVQIDSDGGFMLKGRMDGVVKVGGKRVDLAEIEEKIRRIKGVDDAFVFSMENPGARENQVAALVSGSMTEQELKQEMMALFEPYAVPKRVKITDLIPETPSGKRDRKAILEMFKSD